MKYCRFLLNGSAHYGLVESGAGNTEDEITRLLLQPPQHSDGDVEGLPSRRMDRIPLAQAILLPPVEPSKIVCVGRNYREHAAELGHEVPQEPLLFFQAAFFPAASGRNDSAAQSFRAHRLRGRTRSRDRPPLPPTRRQRQTFAPTSSATPASTTSPPATSRTKTDSGLAPKASTPSAPSAPWSQTVSIPGPVSRSRPGSMARFASRATRGISFSRSTSSSVTFRRS